MSVIIADIAQKPHNRCFAEAAYAFQCALIALGAESTQIVFGANDGKLACNRPGAILYNAEAIAYMDDPLKVIASDVRDHVIWDYALSNVERWKSLGLRAVHVPLGYVPEMETITARAEDVDVLFYGWVNERRKAILDALAPHVNLKVLPMGTYGEERDRWIARSKVVLNLHYYDHSIFEIFRVSHLLANKKCVVTEDGGKDSELEVLALRACFYGKPDNIIGACRHLVANSNRRHAIARTGYGCFKALDLVDNVRRALT